jgi:hypothetical protein
MIDKDSGILNRVLWCSETHKSREVRGFLMPMFCYRLKIQNKRKRGRLWQMWFMISFKFFVPPINMA